MAPYFEIASSISTKHERIFAEKIHINTGSFPGDCDVDVTVFTNGSQEQQTTIETLTNDHTLITDIEKEPCEPPDALIVDGNEADIYIPEHGVPIVIHQVEQETVG